MKYRISIWAVAFLTFAPMIHIGCSDTASPRQAGSPTELEEEPTDTQPDIIASEVDADTLVVLPPPVWGEGPVHAFSPVEADMVRNGNVISYELVASLHAHDTPYGTIPGYAYNGMTPGPTIRGKVGDTLEVTLVNELLTPTTIHWHGAHVPWEMDGATWDMDPVSAGETFVYSFPLTQAGTFWYHPHFDTDSQVDLGLYGMLVVEEEEEPQLDFELLLVMDSFRESKHMEQSEHVHSHGESLIRTWLVNGEKEPEIVIPSGSLVRVRMLNASNMGYLDLSWPEMRVIGMDQGLFGGTRSPDSVVMVPGDRVEVEWRVGDEPFVVMNHSHTLLGGRAYGEPYPMLTIVPDGSETAPEWFSWGDVDKSVTQDPGHADIYYVLTGSPRTGKWLMNGEEYPEIKIEEVPFGETRVIEVRNLSPSQHPFHMHGVSFEVLSINGVPPAEKRIEDTVNLQVYDVMRILVKNDNPGYWMVHCHILGHAHSGMMTVIHFLD